MQKPYSKPQDKRELLWNFIEPGDPYDIRKSMIARIPGDKKILMGDNLEMVCLFQAAEIERLIEYLDQYRLKYKELERQELDRHSYQIQIKELSQRCSDFQTSQGETIKLKQYIRRLKEELDNNRNKHSQDQDLKRKYDNALRELETNHNQTSEFKRQLLTIRSQVENWRSRCEASERSKSRQIDDMRSTFQLQRRTQIDQTEQELLHRFQIQRSQLQMQIRRVREQNNAKTTELEELKFRVGEFNREVTIGHAQLEARYLELEVNNKKYIEELDRLNKTLKDLTMDRNQAVRKFQTVETEIVRRDTEIREYRNMITVHQQNTSQLSRTISELQNRASQLSNWERVREDYENRLVLLTQEVSRLTSISTIKVNEAQQLKIRYNRLEYENQAMKSQNMNLVSRLTEKDGAVQTVGELQHNIMKLTHQNRRLSDETSTIRQSLGGADKLRAENNDLRMRLQELQTQALHTVEEIRRSSGMEVQEYVRREQQNIRRINQLEQAYRNLQSSRPGSRTNIDLSPYKQQLRSLEETNIQIKKSFQQQIINLNRQNQNMKRQLDNQRKRVTTRSPNQDQVVGSLKTQLHNWQVRQQEWISQKEEMLRIASDQQRRSKTPADWEILSKEMQAKIVNYTQQLARNSQFYEATIGELNTQIKRLQDKLRSKNQEIGVWQTKYLATTTTSQSPNRELQRELDDYIERYQQSQGQIILLRQEISNALDSNQQTNAFKHQLKQLLSQNETLKRRVFSMQQLQSSESRHYIVQELQVTVNTLETQNEGLRGQHGELQEILNRLTTDNRSYQSSINALKNQNETLRLRITEAENLIPIDMEARSRIISIEAERDRLNSLLDQKSMDVISDERQLRATIRELDEEVKRLKNNESRVPIHRPHDLEVVTLRRELQGYRNQLVLNQAQIQKLNSKIRTKNEQHTSLDTKYKSIVASRQEVIRMNDQYAQKIQRMGAEIRRIERLGSNDNLQITQIQRLNQVLRSKMEQVIRLQERVQELEREGDVLEEYQRLKSRYQQMGVKVTTYQQKITVASREAQYILRQNSNLNNTIQRLVAQNTQYKQTLIRQTPDKDRGTLIYQENERLIVTVNDLNSALRRVSEQNQLLNRRIKESSQHFQEEFRSHITKYEQQVRSSEQKYLVEQQRFNAAIQEAEQLRRRVTELSGLERNVMEYEVKINNLTGENRRMGEYEQRINALTHQNETLRRQESEKVQKFVLELNEYRHKYPSLQGQQQLTQRQLQQLSQRMEIEISSRMSVENQLRQELSQLRNQLNKAGGQSTEIERLRRTQVQLVNKLNESNRKIVEYESKYVKLNHDMEKLSRLLKERENSQNNSNNNLMTQIQRLNNTLRIKVQESSQWHNKYVVLENDARVFGQEYESLRGVLGQSNQETEAYRRRIQEHQQKLNGQFQKLSMIIGQLKNQNTQLKQENQLFQQKGFQDKNKVLSIEIERLAGLVHQLQQEISELRMRFVDQNALEKRIKQHLTLLVVLFAEIESLRKRVKDKQKEVQQVRRSSLVPFMS